MSTSKGLLCGAVTLFVILLGYATAMAVADRRFDVATFYDTADGSANHFTQNNFDHLNFVTTNGHFMANGTDAHRADLNANGNFLAAYYNSLTSLYGPNTGTAAADIIEQYVLANYTSTGVKPTWLVINEISGSQWPGNADYRAWLRTCMARLHQTYGHSIILFSPFPNPLNNAADWVPLSGNAYIAIEKYLSGAQINAQGNSVSWCQSQYQSSKNSYLGLGIAASQIYLAEHFGQTVAGTGWGRDGCSYAGWDNAIKARAQAAHNVGFTGFIGYAWEKNGMGVSEADQCHFEDTYASQVLP